MKIGVLTLASPEGGGVYQYTLSLLEALKLLDNNKYNFVQIRYTDFPKVLDREIIVENKKSSPILKLKRIIYTFTGIKLGELGVNITKEMVEDIDIIISPIITLLPYYLGKPYIVTIHDFQQEYYPQFFSLRERIARKIGYRTGEFANIVVVESRFVKNDAIKFLGIPEKKIRILPSPPPTYLTSLKLDEGKFRDIKRKYKLPDKYIFYPAQFWYHKNHIKLVQALNLLRRKYKEEIALILVGSKKNNFKNTFKEVKNLSLEKQVKWLGYVPDEDMPYLYKLSIALVMPTLFESVSMPIWEAFYLGVPVVSSNVCALPEQVGDAGLLFDPHDPEDMAEKIYRIWTDEALRRELIQKGYERVKGLTLENYAKEWEKVIEEIFKIYKNKGI